MNKALVSWRTEENQIVGHVITRSDRVKQFWIKPPVPASPSLYSVVIISVQLKGKHLRTRFRCCSNQKSLSVNEATTGVVQAGVLTAFRNFDWRKDTIVTRTRGEPRSRINITLETKNSSELAERNLPSCFVLAARAELSVSTFALDNYRFSGRRVPI